MPLYDFRCVDGLPQHHAVVVYLIPGLEKNAPLGIALGLSQGPVVKPKLGQRLATLETEIVNDMIPFRDVPGLGHGGSDHQEGHRQPE